MFPELYVVVRYRYAEKGSPSGPFWEHVYADCDKAAAQRAVESIHHDPLTIALAEFEWSIEQGVHSLCHYMVDKSCYPLGPGGERPQLFKMRGLVMSYIQDHIFACCANSLLSKLPVTIKE